MSDPQVVVRLLAAIDERERGALAASPGPWRPNAEHDEVLAVDDETVCDGFALSNRQLRATVDHIVANDPTAVLRLCQSHRDIVARVVAIKHLVVEDCWYTCAAATEERDGDATCRDNAGSDCECGRDRLVADLLGALARGYGIEDGETK